jgi:Tol biopolymer transport system component
MSDNRRQAFNIWKMEKPVLSILLGFVAILMILGISLLIRYFSACRELGFYDLSWSPGTLIAYKRVNYFCTIPLWCSYPDTIFAMDEVGREVEIKSGLNGAVDLTWSPDGHQLAFSAGYAFSTGQSSKCSAAVYNIDDGSLRCLSLNGPIFSPAWSPDGAHIAFWSSDNIMNIMDIDGANVIRLPNAVGTVYDSLSWSPNSASIAFVSEINGNYDIYVMQVDGSYLKRLTNDPSDDWSPEWSPDGTRIAFLSRRGEYMMGPTPEGKCGLASGCGYPKTYTMKSDGTDVKRLIESPGTDWYAKWSPDSAKIVLVSERDGNPEIYIVNPDGTGLVRLTDNKFEDSSPVWSTDGTQIAFTSKRNGYLNIYVMNTNGTNVVQMTRNPANAPCLCMP